MQIIINKDIEDETTAIKSGVIVAPNIDENYFVAKIQLYKDQSINLFPKFFTYGIGFAQEIDWNTNLPFQIDAEEIYDHIAINKKYDEISKEECIKAIKELQDIAKKL